RKRARVAQEDGDRLAEIQVAAPAETDDHVGVEIARSIDGLVNGGEIDLRLAVVEDEQFGSALADQRLGPLRDSAADDVAVSHQHDPLAERFTDVAQFLQSPPAEQDPAGGGKAPDTIRRRLL